MKIGAFSEKNQVPISTVRYYISEELLTPNKNGAQYDFEERNEEEMQLISELRSMNFSTEDMKRFVNIVRMLDSRDELRYKQLYSLLQEKREDALQQIQKFHDIIDKIDRKINRLNMEEAIIVDRDKDKRQEHVFGLPSDFLTLLRCPSCGGAISLDNAQIRSNELISGEIVCQCGYHGSIQDGIINVDVDIDLDEDPVFIDDYFGQESLANKDYCIQYEGFLSAKPEFLNIQYKARRWIHNTIIENDLHPKVILFPDIASLFLYLYKDAPYLKDALIIVMGLSRKGIEASRRHLEILGDDFKVMYVISPSNRLPIKRQSTELMVDYLATFNYAFFYDKPLYEFLDNYFADSAAIAGCMANYTQDSRSAKNIQESYVRSIKPFITLRSALNTLRKWGYSIEAKEAMGQCTVLTDLFDYHVSGEAHEIHTFFASR